MIKNTLKLALIAAVFLPVGAYAADGDGNIVTKGYVDSGLVQKANKTDVAAIKSVTDSINANGTVGKANSALQSGDNMSELVNDAGYLTTTTMADYVKAENLGSAAYVETSALDAAYMAKTTCLAGQMLLSSGDGVYGCVSVESGTYTGE